jgi:hypothetical protein
MCGNDGTRVYLKGAFELSALMSLYFMDYIFMRQIQA